MVRKLRIRAIASTLAVAAVLFPSLAQAQLGGIKKLGSKVKDAAVGGANGVAAGVSGKSSADKPKGDELAGPNGKVKDGEAAAIPTSLSDADAAAKVKTYFNGRDIDFTVNSDTARIVTDWYGERRCGPGFYRCANRAMIRVVTEDGKTTVRIQVFERKREGGLNEKPWTENSKSRGKETTELAAALEKFIAEPSGTR